MMGFIHEQDQVVQIGQVVEIGIAQIFGKPFDAAEAFPLGLRVDLGDVEDVDLDLGVKNGLLRSVLIILAGDDARSYGRKLADAVEDVFGVVESLKSAMSLL